jgi:hypothetical protein
MKFMVAFHILNSARLQQIRADYNGWKAESNGWLAAKALSLAVPCA